MNRRPKQHSQKQRAPSPPSSPGCLVKAKSVSVKASISHAHAASDHDAEKMYEQHARQLVQVDTFPK